MKRLATFLSVLAISLLAAPAAFAQEAAATGGASWGIPAKAIGMAIAAAFCGTAQGRAAAAACESYARNPGASDAIRFALILALVLIESMALYVFAGFFIKIV
ncbi:MAG TPA: ATP synthase F0 subunit C [Candidatus Acidoferrales bacterium]|nr:ATP synthase F0 subunit C [Candidatus Acidoferrales bacterium]